jgi:hypothetical protein
MTACLNIERLALDLPDVSLGSARMNFGPDILGELVLQRFLVSEHATTTQCM